MKSKKLYIAAALVFLSLVGLAWALIPPPPVNQNLGLYDAGIASVTNVTCKGCHPAPANTHHLMISSGTTKLGCLDCHPMEGTYPNQKTYIERDCQMCHNGTAFYRNPVVNLALLRPPGRPHHNTTKGMAAYWAINRQCSNCHGSGLVSNYNDGHYIPSYDTSLVTPLADYKLRNATSGREWGGCAACHYNSSLVTPAILNNHDTHHGATSGMLGRKCTYCHVGNSSSLRADGSANVLRIYLTDPYGLGWDTVNRHMEVRNSTIMNSGDMINGTGCEQCHSVATIHNIQVDYVAGGTGDAGKGHINTNWDCNGCHAFWDAGEAPPLQGPISVGMSSVTPGILTPGVAAEVTITGINFLQDPYQTKVLVDGVALTPTSVTDTQIVVTVPALSEGVHSIQLEKGGITGKLSSLIAVTPVDVVTAKLVSGKITITGTGFGSQPDPAFSDLGVFITSSGKKGQTTKLEVISWSDTQIVVSGSGTKAGNLLKVNALNGEDSTSISGGQKK